MFYVRRGQVTIFILIAIFLVGAILIISFLWKDNADVSGDNFFELSSYLKTFVDKSVLDTETLILAQGGYADVSKAELPRLGVFVYFFFNSAFDEEIEVICEEERFDELDDFLIDNGATVINHDIGDAPRIFHGEDEITYTKDNPSYLEEHGESYSDFLIRHMGSEIAERIDGEIDSWMEDASVEFGKRGGDIFYKEDSFTETVSLSPDRVGTTLLGDVFLTKNSQTEELGDFYFERASPLYDFAFVIPEIASHESFNIAHYFLAKEFCDIEFQCEVYESNNPRYNIELLEEKEFNYDYSLTNRYVFVVRVYSIRDTYYDKTMLMATRSCASRFEKIDE